MNSSGSRFPVGSSAINTLDYLQLHAIAIRCSHLRVHLEKNEPYASIQPSPKLPSLSLILRRFSLITSHSVNIFILKPFFVTVYNPGRQPQHYDVEGHLSLILNQIKTSNYSPFIDFLLTYRERIKSDFLLLKVLGCKQILVECQLKYHRAVVPLSYFNDISYFQ